MKLIILTLFLYSNLSFAATSLRKGENAPEDGVFFPTSEAQKLVETDKQKKILEGLVFKQTEKIEIQQQRIDLYKNYLEDNKGMTTIGKLGWFFIGVTSTAIILYSGAQLVKAVK